MKSKTTKINNHWATPDEYVKASVDGLSITTERFASPLNLNVASAVAASPQRTGCLGQFMMPTVTDGKDRHKLTQNVKQKTWDGPEMGNMQCTRD